MATNSGAGGQTGPRINDWLWLGGITTALVFSLLPMASYVAALPIIREDWGLSGSEAGLLNSINGAGAMAGAALILPLTDRFRPASILFFSAVLSAVGHLLFPIAASDVATGAPFRFMAGMGMIGVYVTGTRVVAERFAGRSRGTGIGLYVTSFYLGSSASLLLTGALIPALGWRGAYALWAGIAFVTPPLAYLLLRHHQGTSDETASARLDPSVLRRKPVAIMILAYFLHTFELYHLRTWLSPFLAFVLVSQGRAGATDAAAVAAIIAGAAGILGAFSPFLGGAFSDRVGRIRAATILFAFSAGLSFTIGWTADLPFGVVLGLTLVYSFAVGADSAIYSTSVTEAAEARKLGSTLAMHTFTAFGAGILSPVIFGAFLDLSSGDLGWGLGFSSAGIAGIIAIAAMLWLSTQPEARVLPSGRHAGAVEQGDEGTAPGPGPIAGP